MDTFPIVIQKLLADLASFGVNPHFTGSRAIGVERPSSDWDFVLTTSDHRELINNLCENYKVKEPYNYYFGWGNDTANLYIYLQDDKAPRTIWNLWGLLKRYHKVNLIIVEYEDELDKWINATEFCKENKNACYNKNLRCHFFSCYGIAQK